ncbi:MBL fold metallo-hydrolase [Streptomyces sp. GS7]|nr:MBL fold metallo-hydrolase [Streptomyces sp. GS7]
MTMTTSRDPADRVDATPGSVPADRDQADVSERRQPGPADLRLVAPALAAWAAAAIGLDAPGGGVAVACAVAVALAACALWRAKAREGPSAVGEDRTADRSRPARIWSAGALVAVAAVLLCAAAGAASGALHAAEARSGPLPVWAQRNARLTVELELTGDPRMTRPKVRGSQRTPPSLVFTADAVRVMAPDGSVTAVRTPVLAVVQQHDARKGSGHGAGDDSREGEGAGQGPGDGSEERGAGGRKSAGGGPAGVPDASGTGGRAEGSGGALPEWRGLLPSTRIRVAARAVPPLSSAEPVAAVLRITAYGPPRTVGPPSALQQLAGKLRAGLREATEGLRPDARALLPGLVVGDTSRVPQDLDDAFRATDLTHLLAVSGSNLTIVLTLLIGPPHLAARAERRGLARRLGLSLRGTALVGGGLALMFVVVCRPDPSVLRAAACGLITLLAIGTGRRRSLLPALAAAVLLLVLYDPRLARSYGFLLSVLATGALLLLAPPWSDALRRRRVPPRLAEVIAAAAAAQVVCSPVIAVIAARVGLVAVPCNLLAELAVAPATILGFAALAAAPVALPLAQGLAWCAGWPAGWIAWVARTGAALPGAEFAWPGGWAGGLSLAAASVVLLAVGRRALRRPWLCVLCALALVLAVCRPAPLTRILTGWPPPGWRMVACDVGQGDGLVLAAGDGTALVVDTGPDPRAIDRCLSELGVRRIPLLVLTHFHADHVDGLPGVLRGRSVGAIETTSLQEPYGQVRSVRRVAADARVPVTVAVPGERRRLGTLTWEVLWPPAPFAPPVPPLPFPMSPVPSPPMPPRPVPPLVPVASRVTGAAPGTAGLTGPNDASVTLLVRTGGLTVLLLGDLEPGAQQALLAAHPELSAVDVLKVAHHGSAYQDPQLIHRLAPRLALISCGAGNPYGHPASRTIAALRGQGARVLRTDTDGALAVLGTPAKLSAVVSGRRSLRRTGSARRRRRRDHRPGEEPAVDPASAPVPSWRGRRSDGEDTLLMHADPIDPINSIDPINRIDPIHPTDPTAVTEAPDGRGAIGATGVPDGRGAIGATGVPDDRSATGVAGEPGAPGTTDASLRYLRRIGADRPAVPDAEALRRLHLSHLRAVPFENLSIHLGEEIVLAEGPLLEKIVGARRGGFCYELNGAFAILLRALGYEVALLSARVFGPDGIGIPYDHLALRVRTPTGPWLTDVGFGRHSHYPLRLDSREDQADPGGVFRIEETDEGDLDVLRDGVPQYRVEQRPRALADFEVGCWWNRTSPRSHFTQSLVCSRLTETGRVTLSGRTLLVTGADGAREERELGAAEVLSAYRSHFGISLDREPVVTTFTGIDQK